MRMPGTPLLALAIALAGAAPAGAQDPRTQTDPDYGSPSGAIYEIPFERGRDDGAPLGAGGRGGSGGGGTAPAPAGPAAGSPIRTENGFGSSSQVPGAPAAGEAGSSAGGSEREGGSSGASGSGGGGESAGGSTPTERDATPTSGGEAAGAAPGVAASSVAVSRSLLLLGLGAAVALLLGLAARWASARR